MKTLYLECGMGAAGDMLTAALLELHHDPDGFLRRLNSAGIPNVAVTAVPCVKRGITGTRIKVEINGREEAVHTEKHTGTHGDYHGAGHLIDRLNLSDTVKKNALGVYRLLAEAESHVHGVPVTQIHFHEIGEMDAVADIVGVSMLMEELAPDIVLASPVNVGGGQVRCAHGILPVPAPAAAHILLNVPIYGGQACGELCTPTGAALLKYFVKEFCPLPVIRVDKLGYGMGKKDFETANCLRAYLGDSGGGNCEEVTELSCNLDDMSPEAIAFAQQLLLDEGALDVYTAPIYMKKGRIGILFTCMCKSFETKKFIALLFKHTSTLGIRETVSHRYALERNQQTVHTALGSVRIKISHGYGVTRSKPEYEDIARIARENEKSVREVLDGIQL